MYSITGSTSDTINTEIDEALSILLDDEAEQSHIFVDQSTNALLTIKSDYNNQQRRASLQYCKPSKVSTWHGSCASFGGNNSELLNLSSSWNDSNELCMYLALHTNDLMLGHKSPTTSSSNNEESVALAQEDSTRILQENHGSSSSRQKMSFNVSRFNSSTWLFDSTDSVPTKPTRGYFDNDKDDDTDADFTDIITVNPYDSLCSTLDETMSIIDKLFVASASSDVSIETSYVQSSSDTDVPPNIATQALPERNDFPLASESTTPKSNCRLLGYSIPKKDHAPKRPTRSLSPTRSTGICPSNCDVKSQY